MPTTRQPRSGPLLSPREVASRYPISVSTLGRWRRRGRGPRFIRLGVGPRARLMYREADVEAFLEQCEQQTSDTSEDCDDD